MYLAETASRTDEETLVAQQAKVLGLDPKLAVQKYREVALALKGAADKREYLRTALLTAKKEHRAALETVAELRGQVKKIKDNSKRAEALYALSKEELRLKRVGRILDEGKGAVGMGIAWIPLLLGLTLAGVTIAGYVEFRGQVKKTVEDTGNALMTLTYVTAIGGGVLMLLYMGKLFRDAYGEGAAKSGRSRA
ncbi:MAG TPA: hypothetical protein VEK15_20510 [Vicinamibacteria bacterium]|nr:hypothetical protein [Vicinamibacteria bacterium]